MKSYSTILLFSLILYSAQPVAQNIIQTNLPFTRNAQEAASGSESCLIPHEYEIEIPNIAEDAKPESYTFLVKNRCDKTVRITSVINSCSCLTTQVPDSIFGPGEEKEIILTFNPHLKSGDIFQEAFIYTDIADDVTDFSLRIIGKVIPSADPYYHYKRKIGVLRFKRKIMNFKFTEAGQWLTERLTCVNSSDKEVRISGYMDGKTLPSFIEVRSEPEIIQPGQEADIIVSINNRELQQKSHSLMIGLEGIEAQTDEKGVLIKIENDLKQK